MTQFHLFCRNKATIPDFSLGGKRPHYIMHGEASKGPTQRFTIIEQYYYPIAPQLK